MIEVQDNGPGLADEDMEKLFNPFYHGDTVHNSLIKGSGLGLTITKELVETHGGTIKRVPSERGAHFVVQLPLLNLS